MDDVKTLAPTGDLNRVATASGGLELAGAPEGFDAMVMADLVRARGGVSVFVARDYGRANAFEDALKFFAPDLPVLRFPAWDCLPYDRVSPTPGLAAQRMAALAQLSRRAASDPEPLLVLTTAPALVQRVPPRDATKRAAYQTKVGRDVDVAELERYFAVNGYQRASTVSERGEFAIRGGVIDVFPPGAEEPVRLDLFGDTLESIRAFDPESQRSTRQLTDIDLLPVSEALLDPDSISRFRAGYLKTFGAAGDDPLYAAVSEGVRRQGVEHWLPLLYERLDTLFDYLPVRALIALDHLATEARDERLSTVQDAFEARQEAAKGRNAASYRALPPEALYLTAEEWDERVTAHAWRRFSPFQREGETVVDLGARLGKAFAAERAQDSVNLFEAVAAHAQSLVRRLLRPTVGHAGRARVEGSSFRQKLARRPELRGQGRQGEAAAAGGAAGRCGLRHRQRRGHFRDRHPGRPSGAAAKATAGPELPGGGQLADAGRPGGARGPRHRPLRGPEDA
jgi:transcription-repair coupling factor (superfamily II helicase)